MKLTGKLIRHMNLCTSQIIQQVLTIRMQPIQDMPMPGENDNASDNFGLYEDERSTPEVQNIKRDHRDLIGQCSDTRSYARVGLTP